MLEWDSVNCIASKGFPQCSSNRFHEYLESHNEDILHLTNKKIDHYKGDFDNFENVRYQKLLQQQRAHESQQSRVKHMQQFIDRFRYQSIEIAEGEDIMRSVHL